MAMTDSLYPKEPLVPLVQITDADAERLRIGEDFVDLARLGMIGEYTTVDATEYCPRLYYRWNYQFGVWEIYATEHDLIRYNLVGVSGLRSGTVPIGPTGVYPGPTGATGPEPGPGPEPPEPEDYKVKLSSPDSDWEFNGAIIKFKGLIRWYPYREGHYVAVRMKIGSEYMQYMDSLVMTYRGAKYGKEIFYNGECLLYVSVRLPGQIVPIRFDFTNEIHAQYFVVISHKAIFEDKD